MTKIKQRLKELGMTQIELAEKTGISLASIKQIVNGRSEPTIIFSLKIARVLNREVEYLFTEEGKASEI